MKRAAFIWVFLLLLVSRLPGEAEKIKITFIRYNLFTDKQEISTVKNPTIVAGQVNRIALTLYNFGSYDYEHVTIKPYAKERYLNVKMADDKLSHISVDYFGAGFLETLKSFPIIITVAPTCPDGYRGIVYLIVESKGYARTLRQFVVLVENQGILQTSSSRFNELYGGLGIKSPSKKKIPALRTHGSEKTKRKKESKRGRDSDSINETIDKYALEVHYCYQQQLRKFPTLNGKVIVKFTIRPLGDIINIRIIRSTLYNKEVEDCLVRRMKTWKFPEIAPSYGNLDITYPFIFHYR